MMIAFYFIIQQLLLIKFLQVIDIPLIERYCNITEEHEINQLTGLLRQAIDEFSIDGLVNGAISSNFQLDIFKKICTN